MSMPSCNYAFKTNEISTILCQHRALSRHRELCFSWFLCSQSRFVPEADYLCLKRREKENAKQKHAKLQLCF